MKQTIMTLSFLVSLTLTLLSGGCKDNAVDETKTDPTIWKEVEQFRGVDIRYMVVHNGTLYISAIRSQTNTFALMKTDDGDRWDTLKVFERWIGPIAFHGDTLTILEEGRTWKYHPSFGWEMFWKHLMSAKYGRDMVWLNNTLFVFDNWYRMAFNKDSTYELSGLSNYIVVSRFVKPKQRNKDFAVTRPYVAYDDNISMFTGELFNSIAPKQSSSVNLLPNYPSLLYINDTLFAGFNSPNRLLYNHNSLWFEFGDTIPNPPNANDFSPALVNRLASIAYLNGRFFVGTEWCGVFTLTNNKWVNMSTGLPQAFHGTKYPDLYLCISQMLAFKNRIFIGFGEPWSAPVNGGRGLFTVLL